MNLKQVSEDIGYQALYGYFYSYWSSPTHGESIFDGTLEQKDHDTVSVRQMRYPDPEIEEVKIQA